MEWDKDEKARYIPQNVNLPVKKDEWETKANALLSFGVLKLKSYQEIKNYYLPTDADEVRVEYVFQDDKRSYELIDPFGNKNIPDAKIMCNILNYIESDLGFSEFAHRKNK
ncbi:hypothetical protein [Niabella hibiscisoli]|uniref:hypothetical protein n=1 Tax=Niabella hibiscisoli TaxID=1825928 RepID=UPI001F1126E3|nr:hypothetical protein [Niabella hibiscisoli]MCH5721254.1 hypothetical protein [Niabella hibiscisoli]